MKKVIIALSLVAVLSLALVTPVLANGPNENADWGQINAYYAPGGFIGEEFGNVIPGIAPLAWARGGIPGMHGYSHGP